MININDVTMIIPHLGATEDQCRALSICLESLLETIPTLKIIVVKNGQQDCNCRWDIKIKEQGQEIAVNAGITLTNNDWIMISNDDMVYGEDWWDRLTKVNEGTKNVYLDDNKIWCISPILVEPRPGSPTFIVEFMGGAGGDFDKTKWELYSKEYMRRLGISYPLRTGFNLPFLMKRELWDTIQGYDINYRPFGSNGDSDIEYKVRLAGIQPYQNTNCIVYHFSQTSGTFEPKNQSYWQRNWDYFIQKWGFPRTDEGIWTADFHMPTKEEGRIYFPSWEGKYEN